MGSRIDLEKPGYEIARFRVICALGRSVRANLRKLFDATNRKSNPNWLGIVNAVSDFTDVILPASGASQDPDKQIELVKNTISKLADTWPEANDQLHSVMTDMADHIVPFTKGELPSHLQSIQEAGAALAQKCVTHWGGERAVQALAQITKGKKPQLIFVTESESPTYAYCDNNNDGSAVIALVIGTGKNLLKSYLSLEFYFFHEHLSHIFPRWEDFSGRLSDGYLFALEKAFFRAHCHSLKNGFSLHSTIVENDMGAHLKRSGKETGLQQDIEGLYVWLDSNCEALCPGCSLSCAL
jgi:hypothetical protein